MLLRDCYHLTPAGATGLDVPLKRARCLTETVPGRAEDYRHILLVHDVTLLVGLIRESVESPSVGGQLPSSPKRSCPLALLCYLASWFQGTSK